MLTQFTSFLVIMDGKEEETFMPVMNRWTWNDSNS